MLQLVFTLLHILTTIGFQQLLPPPPPHPHLPPPPKQVHHHPHLKIPATPLQQQYLHHQHHISLLPVNARQMHNV